MYSHVGILHIVVLDETRHALKLPFNALFNLYTYVFLFGDMTSPTFFALGGPASQLNTYLQLKHQTPSWTNNPNHRKYHVLICSTASVLMKGTLRGSCSVDCRTQDKLEDTGIGWVRQLCRGYLYQFSYLTWWNCTTSPIRVVVSCCVYLDFVREKVDAVLPFLCKKGTAKMGRHIVTMNSEPKSLESWTQETTWWISAEPFLIIDFKRQII